MRDIIGRITFAPAAAPAKAPATETLHPAPAMPGMVIGEPYTLTLQRRIAELERENQQLKEGPPRDRNHEGFYSLLNALTTGNGVWPNLWGQDVAMLAYFIHRDRKCIAAYEQALDEARRGMAPSFSTRDQMIDWIERRVAALARLGEPKKPE